MANLSIKTGVISRSMLVGNPPFIPTSFESIATINATGSSVTFSSIPSTYTHLQIRGIYQDTFNTAVTNTGVLVRFNGDSGANYTLHNLRGNGTTALSAGTTGNTSIKMIYSGKNSFSGTTNTFGASIVDVHDYASTTKNKTLRAFCGVDTNGNTSSDNGLSLISGLWVNTSAITSITLVADLSAFASGTTFALYGIKG